VGWLVCAILFQKHLVMALTWSIVARGLWLQNIFEVVILNPGQRKRKMLTCVDQTFTCTHIEAKILKARIFS
jgi:hypothetical protein